jgi:hypothetical protein
MALSMLVTVPTAFSRADFNTVDPIESPETDDIIAMTSDGSSPPASQGGLSASVWVLLFVVMCLIIMAIMLVLGTWFCRKLKGARRPDDDDERGERPLLFPSDDF